MNFAVLLYIIRATFASRKPVGSRVLEKLEELIHDTGWIGWCRHERMPSGVKNNTAENTRTWKQKLDFMYQTWTMFFWTLDNWLCFFFVFHVTLFLNQWKSTLLHFGFHLPSRSFSVQRLVVIFTHLTSLVPWTSTSEKTWPTPGVLAPPLVAASVRIGSGASEKFQDFEKSLFFDIFCAHYNYEHTMGNETKPLVVSGIFI